LTKSPRKWMLYQRDEKREQEFLSIQEQIRRLEAKFA
jgi:hypothetical protein